LILIISRTLSTDFYDGNGQPSAQPLLLQGHLPAKINIVSFKSDYVHPLKKGGRVEFGAKSSFVKNDNLVDYVRWVNNKWVTDARSNHFIYDENINAVYVNANKQVKKWSFQGGLRLENTIAKGYQVNNDSSFKRNFTSLFPSAFISREINKSNTITLSYSRRITRPNYQDLNPFIYFLDSLSYRKGNPFLTPQFTHNFELSHSFKNKLITTLNYNNTTDVISQILKPDGDLVFLTSDNVAKFRNIGISITAPIPVTKWWNLNLFTNIYNNHYKGVYENKPLDIAYTSFMVNMTQTFTLKQGFTLEVNGFYRARGVDQLTINEPMYVINFGGQKQILKGKGTLRLNLRDPFWIQRYKGKTKYDIVDTRVQNRWDNRQVTATFTYRFGKNGQQNPPPRRRNSASQDEQNRVGQGGGN
jgi:iron complex outermembrane recepter protein